MVQTKASPFSIRHIIWVNYKVLSQLSQPIYLEFSYLNILRHFSDVELCREPFYFFWFHGFIENRLPVLFAIDFLAFFNNVDCYIYLFRYLKILWLNKSISLSKSGSHQISNINIHQNIYYSFFSSFDY